MYFDTNFNKSEVMRMKLTKKRLIELIKEAGIKTYLRIVPLFETLSDLQNSHIVMENLFKKTRRERFITTSLIYFKIHFKEAYLLPAVVDHP